MRYSEPLVMQDGGVARGRVEGIKRKDFVDIAPLVCDGGRLRPNPYLVSTIPYEFTLDDVGGDSVASVAALSSSQRTLTNDKSGDISAINVKGVATSEELLVSLYDVEYSRELSNRPLHWKTFVGTGAFPYKLPCPLHVRNTMALKATFRDLSGAPNAARLSLGGHRYYFDYSKEFLPHSTAATKLSRPYFYTAAEDISLPADNTVLVTTKFTIVNDADFLLSRITAHAPSGAFRILLRNMSTGIAFSNGWLHSSIFAGTNINHYDLDAPMLFQRRSDIQINIYNLSGVAGSVYLNFGGTHYYYDRA